MDIPAVQQWLERVEYTCNQHKKIAAITGSNFNIFKILGVESSEVRLHSNFIAELLNPKGSHGQGDLYLSLFINQLGVSNFNSKSATVEVEKDTGCIDVNRIEGGRLDILITDEKNEQIIIENKIYALDQKNQLLRYYNYNPKAHLIYLNLFGDKPREYSTGGLLREESYKVISYQADIIEWLNSCMKESVTIPVVRESIAQYISLIKYLTNSTELKTMSNEIRELIIKNSELIDTIELCSSELQSMIKETNLKFKDLLDCKFPKQEIATFNGFLIKAVWGEDGDGIHFGYLAEKDGKNLSNAPELECLRLLLKEINKEFHLGGGWLGWINPSHVKRRQKFKSLPSKEIVRMYSDHEYLNSFAEKILIEEAEIQKRFLAKLNQVDLNLLQ